MKALIVHFEGGNSFSIPAEFVANNRANYYYQVDPTTNYTEEMEYALADEFELVEWAQNNLDWVDVEDVAFPYWPEQIDESYAVQWVNAEMEVIEI